MVEGEDRKVAIALPGEWALQKVLGPTLDLIGADLSKLYAAGRDRIVRAAAKKTENLDDGASANLRIAADVFRSGAFADSDVCAEYFGGILAASRGESGGRDDGMFYLELIKS